MLSEDLKNKILNFRNQGYGYKVIARKVHMSRDRVRGVCLNRGKCFKKKRGPHFKLNKSDKIRIKRQICNMEDRGEKINSSKLISSCDLEVSKSTVCRHLKKSEMKYKNIPKKIQISKADKKIRVEHITRWISENHTWEKTIFSDEKWFSLDGPDNWQSYQKENTKNIRIKRQKGGGGIMIWMMVLPTGLLAHKILPRDFKSKNYMGLIKEIIFPLCALNFGPSFWFQQDNAPVHRSKDVQKCFKDININVLSWPPRSPDLNIAENIWKMLQDIIYDGKSFENKANLEKSINKAFRVINDDKRSTIVNIYNSYRHRLCCVLNSKGNIYKQ